MHDRIEHGANLLENHVFQFDFLNDDFSKLPQGLQDIINNRKTQETYYLHQSTLCRSFKCWRKRKKRSKSIKNTYKV
jgi:hypothetical protein